MSTIGAVISDGGLTAILDLTAAAVLYTAPANTPFASRTGSDRVPSGTFAFGNNGTASNATGPLSLWRWNTGALFNSVATVAAPTVVITSNSLANPSIVTTAAPHFLLSGQSVTIAGVVGSVPTINGTQIATVLTPTTFSVPVNVSTGGTGGTVQAGNAGAWYAVSANGVNLWAADTTGSVTRPVFRKISGNPGAVLSTVGPITALTNSARFITPAIDESVMYYTSSLSGAAIKQWNIAANTAGADVVSPAGIIVGMWTVPSSTDIVVLTQSGAAAPISNNITRYTTAGAVVYTRDFYDLPAGVSDLSIQTARDPDLTSVWARLAAAPLYLQTVSSIYIQLDLATGVTRASVSIPGATPIGFFLLGYGAPAVGVTYPFLIVSPPGGTPGSPGTPCGSFT